METPKVLSYSAMVVAGLVCLLFLLDAGLKIFGRNLVLDILFIMGGAFVLWQGFETTREAALESVQTGIEGIRLPTPRGKLPTPSPPLD